MITIVVKLYSIRPVIVMIIVSIMIFMFVGELKDEKIFHIPCEVWFLIFDVDQDDHLNFHVLRLLI